MSPDHRHDWDDLLAAIREARLHAGGGLAISSNGTDKDDRRRRLMEGAYFSARFIPTYHAVLCAIVLVFTTWHWGILLARYRRGVRRTDSSTIETTSSSSSTLSGNATPPELAKSLVYDERSSLLGNGRCASGAGLLRRIARMVHSLGMYQPTQVADKTLPSNSTSLVVLLLLGINVFYSVYRTVWTMEMAFVFSDRTALLFVANLPWLYVLSAKNQPLRLLTGYAYENLNILHRVLGGIMCFLALAHTGGMLVAWYAFFKPVGMTLIQFLSLPIIVLGLLALACYELLYVTSTNAFREWWYELFLGLHVFLQVAALAFVWFHHKNSRTYVGAALAIFVLDRLLFRLAIKSRSVRADLTVMEDGNTVKVSADWPVARTRFAAVFGSSVKNGWTSSEHTFLTIPAISRKHLLQSHPMTIASAAPLVGQDHAWLNLIIRAHDGFTRDLLHHAKEHPTAMVRFDGPYGSHHALHMLQDSDIAIMIVGGSGIAVSHPLVWSLLHDAWSGRRKVGLIWVVHEASHLSWIGHERLDELKALGLHLVVPAPTAKAGRPDVAALLEDMVNDLKVNEEDPRIGVVVSGPDSMNRAVRNRCAGLAWRGIDIDVSVEKYGW
ncbi:hypothetical protein LTR97_006852 [Elasticomyces elasticus]|uniref:FAD-binding FR-type domain-containing protein n=1 Tax=Elasticomyces elasticus TaxID=574655 RepID=A0AAN8A187_9PEZI|nr:hypothetical protein LTR97_006852 [Elasticomyces elasticus]